ncbi:MAG: hypothetical protein ACI89J_000903, partial [Hyphomicrobiaceae bacterium]
QISKFAVCAHVFFLKFKLVWLDVGSFPKVNSL